jgi:hypothetical protein
VATKGVEDVAGSKPKRLKIKGSMDPERVPHNTTPIREKKMVKAKRSQ